MEEEGIHDIFQEMMVHLIKDRPENPVESLINKLSQPEKKRVVLVFPPGLKHNSENIALLLNNYFTEDQGITDIKYISVCDLLDNEVLQKTDYGTQIQESRKTYSYVSDEIVIDLVQRKIEKAEKDGKGWILEGFPRTRLQAIALQNMKVIPDKMFFLNCADHMVFEKLQQKLWHENSSGQHQAMAQSALTEYRVNL